MVPTAGQVKQHGALLCGEYLRHLRQGIYKSARGRVRQLQFCLAELPEDGAINRWLSEGLKPRLMRGAMLFPHLPQVMHRRLDNGLHLLALFFAGLDPTQDPISCELGSGAGRLCTVGGVVVRSPGAMAGSEPPMWTMLGLCI
jgi:hypothetical protein